MRLTACQKRTRKSQQLTLSYWLIIHADPQSQCSTWSTGHQKRTRKRQQLAHLYSVMVHTNRESQHGQWVTKKGQGKDNSLCFCIRSFTLIQKSMLNAVDRSPKKDKKKPTTHTFIFVDRSRCALFVDRVWKLVWKIWADLHLTDENILNINKTSFAFTFITFTTQ